MAGHTNRAFRQLVREIGGCGLVCTELISSQLLQRKSTREKSMQRFDWDSDLEYPVAVQLFGSDAQTVAEAAKIVVDNGATIIDINMGCWVPKIAKKGGGAALLRDVDTATAVVEAVVNAVDVPVTVKVRTGFEDGIVTAVPFAQAAEQCGVQAVAVHARFAGQGHGGDADWDVIQDVKQAVTNMPVLGNGDVHTGDDAARMLARTGCDGVMIGRAALGQPWLFRHIAHYFKTGEVLPRPSRAQRAAYALRHAELTLKHTYLPQHVAVREMRGQLSKYQLDDPGSVRLRNKMVRVETMQDVEAILKPLIAEGD
jgi:nifR3 family TIM-barrel protein